MEFEIPAQESGLDLLYGRHGPTAKQAEFRDSPKKFRLYGGAVGGGKSVALCAELLRAQLAFPGNRGFICRHEATAFRMTTLATLMKLIGELEDMTGQKILTSHHKTERVLHFPNGSVLMYGALGEAEDFERIKSMEVGCFGIDEASETVHENYLMLCSRLRWRLPNGTYPPFFGLLASNPEPGWVKDTFVKPHQLGVPLPNHTFIQALPRDNPFLPPDYIESLRQANPEDWVKRYIEGSWDALEGQVWPMFSFDQHVIEPFDIPYEWPRFRAIDHGQDHPTVCLWFAVGPDSEIYVYREYYMPGIVSKHAKEIRAMSAGERYDYTVLPPECWGATREKYGRLWSVCDEYHENEIYCIQANNEVMAGVNRVGEYLTPRADRVHPRTGQYGAPRLYIFRGCTNLLLEIPDYSWKTYKTEEKGKERPKKLKDDACDALRYGVMTRPTAAQLTRETPRDTFMATRARVLLANKLAQRGRVDRTIAYDRITRRLI